MEELVWTIIEESKGGKDFLPSEQQFENFGHILDRYDPDEVRRIRETWSGLAQSMRGDEYNKLHEEAGGPVSGGDDNFYMDFGNWLLAQGKELYDAFFEKGHEAVIRYIEKHDIPSEDYEYECMLYMFHDYEKRHSQQG